MTHFFSEPDLNFARDLKKMTGEDVMRCSHCGKCTLACPSAYAMKMKPDELMQAIQLGMKEEVFWSGILWTCVSCETCSTRCIDGIDILRVIDGLRQMAFSKKLVYYDPLPAVPSYHRLFLFWVTRFGRLYELGLIAFNDLKMLTPFREINLLADLLRKRKLKLLPDPSRGRKELRQLMTRIRKMEGGVQTTSE